MNNMQSRPVSITTNMSTQVVGPFEEIEEQRFRWVHRTFLFTRSTFQVQRLGRQKVLLVGWPRSAFFLPTSVDLLFGQRTDSAYIQVQSVSQTLCNTRSTFSGLPKSWCIHVSSLKLWAWARPCTTLSLNSSSSARSFSVESISMSTRPLVRHLSAELMRGSVSIACHSLATTFRRLGMFSIIVSRLKALSAVASCIVHSRRTTDITMDPLTVPLVDGGRTAA